VSPSQCLLEYPELARTGGISRPSMYTVRRAAPFAVSVRCDPTRLTQFEPMGRKHLPRVPRVHTVWARIIFRSRDSVQRQA
jgi:hypothetical protein